VPDPDEVKRRGKHRDLFERQGDAEEKESGPRALGEEEHRQQQEEDRERFGVGGHEGRQGPRVEEPEEEAQQGNRGAAPRR